MFTKWISELDKKVVLLFSAALVTISFGTASTVSYFTDQVVTTVQVSAGTIELGIGDENLKAHTLDLGTEWYPGASKTETLTIHNSGVFPMTYSAVSLDAEPSLTERINVTMSVDEEIIYQGKINSISIPERTLPINSSEVITFSMDWPWTNFSEDDRIEAYQDYTTMGTTSSTSLIFTSK